MQGTQNEDVVEIDLQELFGLLLHWLWLILLCGALAGVLGFSISRFVLTPQYESTTKVYVINKTEGNLTYSDLQTGTQLTKDYTQLIKSRNVLEQVMETCSLEEGYDSFSQRVDVEALTDTRIIAITVTDEDPAMARLLATEICEVASEYIKDVMDLEAVNLVETAYLPETPSSPSVLKWTGAGFLLGAFLCTMVVVLRFLMDDTVKTSDDIEKYLELSTLAMIPVIEDTERRRGRKGHSPLERGERREQLNHGGGRPSVKEEQTPVREERLQVEELDQQRDKAKEAQ